MSKLELFKSGITRAMGSASLGLKAKSPELLVAAGVIGVVTSGVLLVRQTLKVAPIGEKHELDKLEIRSRPVSPHYSESDRNRDMTRVYLNTTGRLTKHYGPAITVGVLGVTSLLVSNGILQRRNVAILGAYKALEGSFSEYRKRVIEKVGPEEERDIYHGFRREEVEDEVTGETKTVTTVDPNGLSIYARFFDELNPYWRNTPEYNLIFLKNKQSYFNDLLQTRGHVFLNEVYKELGIPENKIGQYVGWQVGEHGDNYIDFNIYDFNSEKARDFVNGFETSIRLDFNVDGVIIDKIGTW